MSFQNLLTCIKASESRPVRMSKWIDKYVDCGTAGCLIGNYYMENGRGYIGMLLYESDIKRLCNDFSITYYEFQWLFLGCVAADGKCLTMPRILPKISKEEALSRLRKFVYYKMHKQELIIETGRNKRIENAGRNISGNQAAVKAAKEVCEVW